MLIAPVRDELLRAGDLTFHTVQWGDQGPPLVCVHGLTANAFCFQAFADELARDHRVFAYDLRGRGRSERPAQGYSVPLHAGDLDRLLDVWGLEQTALLGHSLGALIALYYAAHHPQRVSKLVLVDAGAPLRWRTPDEQPQWLKTSVARLGTPAPSLEAYKQRLKAAPYLGPYWNAYFDHYFEHDVEQRADGSVISRVYREGVIEESLRGHEARPAEQWGAVQAPTLLLRAGASLVEEGDQLLSEEAAQTVVRHMRRCRLVTFPTLNHYTILFGVEEGPARAIRAFLDEETVVDETAPGPR
jgi:pimeloyl-ACP methyl ester carboxylesterase